MWLELDCKGLSTQQHTGVTGTLLGVWVTTPNAPDDPGALRGEGAGEEGAGPKVVR